MRNVFIIVCLILTITIEPIQATSCCGDSYIIQQSNMPYTIKQEGSYCLAESVTGTITIDADKVILDLAGRSIAQSDININVEGQSDIIICNGRIESASNIGIAVDGATNIILQDLDFIGNDTGVLVETSTWVSVDRCTFRDHAAQALIMQGVNVGHITDSLFQQNHGDAVVQLDNDTHITCENVEIIGNNSTNDNYSGGIMASYLYDSDFVNCKISGNTSTTTTYNYAAFTLRACYDVRVRNCVANNNESISVCTGFLVANSFNPDFSKGIMFDSCIANSNNSTATVGFSALTVGFFLLNGDDMSIINCVAHNNHAAGQSCGIVNLGATNAIIKNNSVINNIGEQDSFGILIYTNDVAWSNEVRGHTQNFYGIMPKVTYDSTDGIFKVFGTNTPTTPTFYDNINIK